MEIETNLIGSEVLRKIYEVNKPGQTSLSIPKNNLTCISDKCFIGYTDALSILKAIAIECDPIKELNHNVLKIILDCFWGTLVSIKTFKKPCKIEVKTFIFIIMDLL